MYEALKAEVKRLVGTLPETSMEDYSTVLRNIEGAAQIGMYLEELGLKDEEPVKDNIRVITTGPAVPDPDEKAAEPEPVPELGKTPAVDDDAAHPKYVLASVRGALSLARAERGIDITAILTKMGYKGLSEVPQADYGELLQLAGVDPSTVEVEA